MKRNAFPIIMFVAAALTIAAIIFLDKVYFEAVVNSDCPEWVKFIFLRR